MAYPFPVAVLDTALAEADVLVEPRLTLSVQLLPQLALQALACQPGALPLLVAGCREPWPGDLACADMAPPLRKPLVVDAECNPVVPGALVRPACSLYQVARPPAGICWGRLRWRRV